MKKGLALLFFAVFIISQVKGQCTFTANIISSGPTNICGPDSITLTAEPVGNIWTQKTDFMGIDRYEAVSFSIGNKGYIGTGIDDNFGTLSDFWEYDQATDSWSQVANYGGGTRSMAVGFSIGNKGYVGTGGGSKEFWEYDPAINTWTQKANFGGSGRSAAFGFSIGNKGYIGSGMDGNSQVVSDFWEYNSTTDVWTQKANSLARYNTIGFSIGNRGYAGIGSGYGVGPQYDFSVYNPVSNTWSGGGNFTGQVRENAFAFTIGGKGYIGGGNYYNNWLNDFWEFDPITNGWTQKANCAGTSLIGSSGFSIGNKGYVSNGLTTNTNNSFWEYDQSYNHVWSNGATSPTINVHSAAMFSVNVTDMSGCSSSASQSISVNTSPTVLVTSSSPSICVGNSVMLSASGADTYVWSNSATSASISVSPSVTTTYTLEGFSTNGCSAISIITQSVSTCIGINELTQNDIQIKIYPNPTASKFSIETKMPIHVTVFNALGKEIYRDALYNEMNNIDLSDFSDGLYFVKINHQNFIENIKLVKASIP